jgi:uncharacterized membrane protein
MDVGQIPLFPGPQWIYNGYKRNEEARIMMGLLLLGLLTLVGGLLALLGAGATRFSRQATARTPRTARQVLDERLARGEIDRQEYDRIRGRIE